MSEKTIKEIKECYAKEKEDDIECSNCEVSFWCHLLNVHPIETHRCKCGFEFEWNTYRKKEGLIECGMCEQRYEPKGWYLVEMKKPEFLPIDPEWTARRPQL